MVRPGPISRAIHLNMAEDIHDALARTLADIRTRLGADAFEDRRRALALLSDMLPGATRQIRLLGIAFDNGAVRAIATARPDQAELEIDRHAQRVDAEIGVRKAIMVPVLHAVAYAAGRGGLPSSYTPIDPSVVVMHPAPPRQAPPPPPVAPPPVAPPPAAPPPATPRPRTSAADSAALRAAAPPPDLRPVAPPTARPSPPRTPPQPQPPPAATRPPATPPQPQPHSSATLRPQATPPQPPPSSTVWPPAAPPQPPPSSTVWPPPAPPQPPPSSTVWPPPQPSSTMWPPSSLPPSPPAAPAFEPASSFATRLVELGPAMLAWVGLLVASVGGLGVSAAVSAVDGFVPLSLALLVLASLAVLVLLLIVRRSRLAPPAYCLWLTCLACIPFYDGFAEVFDAPIWIVLIPASVWVGGLVYFFRSRQVRHTFVH